MDKTELAALFGPMFENIAHDGALALETLGLPAGAKVLDVGTGEGKFAIFLALQGFDVLTGEPSTDQTHYAGKDWAQNAEKAGVRERIRFEPFDASKMPFTDGAFGAVFFFGVLHHVDEVLREDVLGEALRVAGEGGTVAFFEPRPELLEKIWVDDPGHPLAADPSAYLAGRKVREQRLAGKMMDIYLYTNEN